MKYIPNVSEESDFQPSENPGDGRSPLARISNTRDDAIAPSVGALAQVQNRFLRHIRYSASHEWIEIKEGIGIVGVSSFAQTELGEVVYVQLPEVGKKVRQGEEVVVLESTKAAADIYSPVSGEIIAVNEELNKETRKLNESPENEGWLFKIRIAHPPDLDSLLSLQEYTALVQP